MVAVIKKGCSKKERKSRDKGKGRVSAIALKIAEVI